MPKIRDLVEFREIELIKDIEKADLEEIVKKTVYTKNFRGNLLFLISRIVNRKEKNSFLLLANGEVVNLIF